MQWLGRIAFGVAQAQGAAVRFFWTATTKGTPGRTPFAPRLDDRDLGLIDEVSRAQFSHLSDDEIASLHAYLVARAEAVP